MSAPDLGALGPDNPDFSQVGAWASGLRSQKALARGWECGRAIWEA